MSRGHLAAWAAASVLITCIVFGAATLAPRGVPVTDLITPESRAAIVLQLDVRGPASVDQSDSDRLAMADRLQYQHRFAAAEAVLSAHLANQPGDENALLRRAQIRIEAGRPREALADCLRASSQLSALAATACQAQALAALGQTQRAREQIETALSHAGTIGNEAAPIRSWAAGIAADLAARLGDAAVAERRYRESVAIAGDAHFPRIAFAQFLLANNRPKEAMTLLATAPDDSSVMRLRRIALEMSR